VTKPTRYSNLHGWTLWESRCSKPFWTIQSNLQRLVVIPHSSSVDSKKATVVKSQIKSTRTHTFCADRDLMHTLVISGRQSFSWGLLSMSTMKLMQNVHELLCYSNHILWTKQAQSNQSTQGLFMPFLSCHFSSNTKYGVLILCYRPGAGI